MRSGVRSAADEVSGVCVYRGGGGSPIRNERSDPVHRRAVGHQQSPNPSILRGVTPAAFASGPSSGRTADAVSGYESADAARTLHVGEVSAGNRGVSAATPPVAAPRRAADPGGVADVLFLAGGGPQRRGS